ncbi:unnamed protein product [Albugo candida]|nr:unnamed protein product [Albugo candida]|eukprot:CCI47883.1 unnamed protein product [Albugo candida]
MRLAKTGMLSSVAVDGFYGSEIEMHPHMIFLAGGTGMVPFLSFLRELEWLVDRKARDNFPESIFIVWTSRDLILLEQYNALLRKIKSSTLWNIDIHIHCTRRESSKIVHITPFTQTTRSITFPRILISSRYRLMVFSSMSLLSMLAVGIVYTIDFDAWWIKQLVVLLSALGALIAGSLMPFFPNGEVSISPTKGLSTLFMADATRTMEVTYGRPQWPSIMRQIQSQMETYDKDDVLDAYICGPEGFYQDVLSSTPSTIPIRYHVKSFAV